MSRPKTKRPHTNVQLTPEAYAALLRQEKRTRMTKRNVLSLAMEEADKRPDFGTPKPNVAAQ